MKDVTHLRPVSSDGPALSVDDAQEAASAAYSEARSAQLALVADLYLTKLVHRKSRVTPARLRGELAEARKQVAHAQAVVDGLTEALDALEAGTRGGGSCP